jgi:hypothetical protein
MLAFAVTAEAASPLLLLLLYLDLEQHSLLSFWEQEFLQEEKEQVPLH